MYLPLHKSPLSTPLICMAGLMVASSIPKEKPQSHKAGQGHTQGVIWWRFLDALVK